MDRFSEESPSTYCLRRTRDAAPDPFFAEALPCESCGLPIFGERVEAYWFPGLMVGACCMVPEEDICPAFRPILETCKSVDAVSIAMSAHMATCPACAGLEFRKVA